VNTNLLPVAKSWDRMLITAIYQGVKEDRVREGIIG
jgi:hypothetical protein